MIIAGQETKDYIGDSVYADFDGYAIVLTTENGYGPSNTIVMEPQVIAALELYLVRLKRLIAEDNKANQQQA